MSQSDQGTLIAAYIAEKDPRKKAVLRKQLDEAGIRLSPQRTPLRKKYPDDEAHTS